MDQLALARRYRPRTFQEMVGQALVVRALSNALDSKRLHHAYLFTGTRGVGKTTIARIFAKCLNCEQGVSSHPCGHCFACQAIDKGNFVDLIEVDAASRTKVEDTRELLDNVQYLPTQGRFKIYIIDEVHMLSGHSFNALLKTLEEPPLHVKFLLATTDPEKLPATVLSRCLQFHLWRLPLTEITEHLARVLQKEGVSFTAEALTELARAADGSLRDALSLLDQAINFSHGSLEADAVRSLLGVSEHTRLLALLAALLSRDCRQVFHEMKQLVAAAPDFSALLADFLELLHAVAIAQSVPEALEEGLTHQNEILGLAAQFSPEEIQLYYQIGLQGQRDLPFAPTPKIGFEMTLLRMAAFQPVRIGHDLAVTEISPQKIAKNTLPATAIEPAIPAVPLASEETEWSKVLGQLNLTGLTKALAEHCVVEHWETGSIHLILDAGQKLLLNKRHEERLQEALSQYYQRTICLKIVAGEVTTETPAVQNGRQKQEVLRAAHQMIEVDSKIQKLIQAFDAKIEQVALKEND